MSRPSVGDKVIIDLPAEDRELTGTVVDGPWISNGEVQGKPTWKVDHGGGFSNWYLEERIALDPEGSGSS